MTDWIALIEEAGRWRALKIGAQNALIATHKVSDPGSLPAPLMADPDTPIVMATCSLAVGDPHPLPCPPM